MLATAMFNRRCKPEIYNLLLHKRKCLVRRKWGAETVMRLSAYCRILKIRKHWMLRVQHFLLPHVRD